MSNVDFYLEGHIAHVRLNRPKSLNAINGDMDQSLFEAWQEINNNPEIWVAVLSGEGDRAFCVGGDISGGTERASRMAVGGGLTGIAGPLVKLKKPLIAAVQGYALGGGFELALCADIIVAADNAQFGLPETKAGIIGECGVVHRVVRQLPQRIAMAMILTGDRMSAQDALAYGLVNEVVEPGNLAEAALRWAEKVAAASPLANQAAKDAAMSRLDYPLEVALATRFEPIEAYASSEDVLEGRNAFVEKRKPEWKGR
ncbi:MAG: enoyl-CoA hydratase/isomerase family protein [Pseudomonas sp.]|uniref:enoyl-CoA hydratase-related protein n=1 Tax=Pseudomonas TaxID=286 RepID=UPI00179D00D2|nr:enoyl-CoA hydratase-related protein [Pseudomonas monteilii]MBA4681423.1 enoyl-CoA hydratase/isomerase family protein [Pseudomonas sp.]MDD2126962.1 enoyl-CoA hydratase-related protein [Pseudomonas monteilii]